MWLNGITPVSKTGFEGSIPSIPANENGQYTILNIWQLCMIQVYIIKIGIYNHLNDLY